MSNLYSISVSYVDFPMGASPEYHISSGHTLREAEDIVERYLQEVDKDPQKFSCRNPCYYIKDASGRYIPK